MFEFGLHVNELGPIRIEGNRSGDEAIGGSGSLAKRTTASASFRVVELLPVALLERGANLSLLTSRRRDVLSACRKHWRCVVLKWLSVSGGRK